jgi:type I restriction enzyme M protein
VFEPAFKYVDDVLRKEAGCSKELDHIERSSWVLFLKYLDDLKVDSERTALLTSKAYKPVLDEEYWLRSCAAPKTATGEIDLNKALMGDDLVDFVEKALWPCLASFKKSATSPDTLGCKIGEIFSEIDNKIFSGSNLW